VSAASRPGRPDRVAGRPLSPRAFRPFGIEAVVLGPASAQAGLSRREGVAVWRRLPEHAALFDRIAGPGDATEALAVRVVVATTPGRARALRVPALGERAARVEALSGPDGLPPAPGWLLLVDEGPGETWLYLAEDDAPDEALAAFLGRRGRTDFARARRRSRLGGIGSLGVFAALVLIVYAPALGLGAAGQVLGAVVLAVSIALLVAVRPR
jgi:hypothetical protein